METRSYLIPSVTIRPKKYLVQRNAKTKRNITQILNSRKHSRQKRQNRWAENIEQSRRPGISIIGLNKIANPNYHWFVRLLWIIILITVMGLCGVQLMKCIRRYFDKPVINNIEVIRSSQLPFPALYVCTGVFRQLQYLYRYLDSSRVYTLEELENLVKDPYELSLFKHVPPFNSVDINKIWSYFLDPAFFTFYQYCGSADQNCEENGKRVSFNYTFVQSYWGTCIGFDTGQMEQKGPFSYIELRYQDKHYNSFIKYVKEKQIELNHTYLSPKIGLLVCVHPNLTTDVRHVLYFDCQEIFQGYQTHVGLRVKEFVSINRKDFFCGTADDYLHCLNKCYDNAMSKYCRLPYVHTNYLEDCPWNSSFIPAQLNNNRVYDTFSFANCTCPFTCHDFVYSVSLDVVHRLKNSSNITIKFYFPESNYEKTVDVYAYEFNKCLSDIGGNLGFFLGFCILTVVELIEFLIYRVGFC